MAFSPEWVRVSSSRAGEGSSPRPTSDVQEDASYLMPVVKMELSLGGRGVCGRGRGLEVGVRC